MKVAIIADVSGSVGRGQLNSVLHPAMDALEEAGHTVLVVFADTEIRATCTPDEVRAGNQRLKLVGHGGTDMATVRHAVLRLINPDFVVVLSDGFY